jgi:hypothetical protein
MSDLDNIGRRPFVAGIGAAAMAAFFKPVGTSKRNQTERAHVGEVSLPALTVGRVNSSASYPCHSALAGDYRRTRDSS